MAVLNHPAAKWDTSTALRQTDDGKHRRPLQAKSDVELYDLSSAYDDLKSNIQVSVVGAGGKKSKSVRVIGQPDYRRLENREYFMQSV
jgi:hypothetical protein